METNQLWRIDARSVPFLGSFHNPAVSVNRREASPKIANLMLTSWTSSRPKRKTFQWFQSKKFDWCPLIRVKVNRACFYFIWNFGNPTNAILKPRKCSLYKCSEMVRSNHEVWDTQFGGTYDGLMARSQVLQRSQVKYCKKSILGRLLIWSGSKTVKIWEKSVSDNLIGGRWVGENKAWKDLKSLAIKLWRINLQN